MGWGATGGELMPCGFRKQADMQIVLRTATTDDASAIAVIGTNVWIDTYAANGLTPEIARYVAGKFSADAVLGLVHASGCAVVLAELNGHTVGYAVLKRDSPCPATTDLGCELSTLYVLRSFRSQGVGDALFRWCTAFARREWANPAIWLRMNSQNRSAYEFYTKRSMHQVGSVWVVFDGERNENYILAGPRRA